MPSWGRRLLALGVTVASAGPGRCDFASVSILDLFAPIRAAAIGGAGVGIGNDATLASLNPAAAARLPRTTLTFGGQRGFIGDLLGHAGLCVPTYGGTWIAGLQYYLSPTIRCFTSTGGTRDVQLQQDVLIYGGYSRSPSSVFSWGVAAKVLQSVLFGDFKAQTGVLDAGAQLQLSSHLKAGCAIRNLGPSFRYFEDEVPPATEARAGLVGGWLARTGSNGASGDIFLIAVDVAGDLASREIEVCAGAEYKWAGILSFRAGGCLGGNHGELARPSAGLGLSSRTYRLDYSIRVDSTFSMPQAVSLTVTF